MKKFELSEENDIQSCVLTCTRHSEWLRNWDGEWLQRVKMLNGVKLTVKCANLRDTLDNRRGNGHDMVHLTDIVTSGDWNMANCCHHGMESRVADELTGRSCN